MDTEESRLERVFESLRGYHKLDREVDREEYPFDAEALVIGRFSSEHFAETARAKAAQVDALAKACPKPILNGTAKGEPDAPLMRLLIRNTAMRTALEFAYLAASLE